MRRVYCFHMGRKERGFMSQNVTKKLLNIITILVGNAIYALGVVIFILPNDLITGGTTGLGLAFEHYFHVPLSAFVFCFNAVMFILGALVLGKMFAFSTLISSFFYPIILGVFQKIPELSQITQDKMLSTVCGGLMIGFAIGIVIRAGASTGGMDIPPLVLNKKFGLPVSVMLYVFDFAILISQMLFSDKEQIIYGDFLKADTRKFFPDPFSVIGNLPYNISSQIFFRVIQNRDIIPQVVCMIQKEVAERISAPCGNKTYGILSVLLQTYYDIEYLFTVNEQVFDPPPKVKSAVIRLVRNRRQALPCGEGLFFNVVKTGFNQRRKTLRNSLKSLLPDDFASEKLTLRPEQLSVEDFIALCQEIEKQNVKVN